MNPASIGVRVSQVPRSRGWRLKRIFVRNSAASCCLPLNVHRLVAGSREGCEAALKEVAHAVRTALSDRATSQVHLENYSLGLGDIWSACSGLTGQGLSALESHMIYKLRFVVRSYSQDTHEASQEPLRPQGVKTAKTQILERLRRFIRRQDANEDSKLSSMYLPRAQQLETTIGQLKGVGRERAEHQETLLTCNDCGAIFIGTGALRRHSQKQHPHSSSFPKEPKFDPIQHSRTGSAECLACGRAFKSYFFLRKHIEDSTSRQVHTLLRQSSDSLQRMVAKTATNCCSKPFWTPQQPPVRHCTHG